MLPALNLTLAMILALAFLLLCIAGPFLLLWIGLSVRRDLKRIADAQEHVARYARSMLADADLRERIADAQDRRTVANSMFGR